MVKKFANTASSQQQILFSSSMPSRTNPWAFGTAAIVNGGILALIILLGVRVIPYTHPHPGANSAHLDDISIFPPGLFTNGGGSGGRNESIPAIQGRAPDVSAHPLLAPQPNVIDRPKLAIDPSVDADIQMQDNSTMPTVGVHRSVNVTVLSSGPGRHGGMGTGGRGGVGSGDGSGSGDGGPRGTGDDIYLPGRGGVVAPVPIFAPEAEFSEEARRQKYSGVCIVSIVVDVHGIPHQPRILRSLGMGLDEKAVEAVLRYRFKPGTLRGRPVATQVQVYINFRMF